MNFQHTYTTHILELVNLLDLYLKIDNYLFCYSYVKKFTLLTL